MGGKSGGQDYGDIAASDDAYNRESIMDQLFANRPDQYTPWGAQTWQQTPYTDPSTGIETQRWTQSTSLTPELQDMYNKQMAIQGGKTDVAGMLTGRMGAEFGQQMDWRGLNPMGQVPTAQFTLPEHLNRNLSYEGIPGIGDPSQYRERGEDAAYQKAMSRLDPQHESQRKQMEIKLRNQGLGPQDAAWQSAMQSQGRTENDANQQAIWNAVGEGRQESNLMFGQDSSRRAQYTGERDNQANYFNQAAGQAYSQALGANAQNFGQMQTQSNMANQIRQQQLTEAMQKRGFSLNEINALMSGGQVGMPQMPNFSQAGVAAPASGMTGAANQGSVDAANNPWSAILGAAGTGAGIWAGLQ